MPEHAPDHTPAPQPPAARARLGERLRGAFDTLGFHVFSFSAGVYLAAGSLIGFESLALLFGYATLWPVAIPIAIAGIALVGLILRRVRRRRDSAADGTAQRATTTNGGDGGN